MSDVLTVPTHFGDLSELSQGLVDRVDEDRIILYGPNPYAEGEAVGFSVLLVDGTPALEGVGRIAAAVDGGEERDPETRYDIVFDELQLEGRSEVVYERIVLARQSMMGEAPQTGEVDLSEVEAIEHEASEPAFEEPTPQYDAADVAQDPAYDDGAYAEQPAYEEPAAEPAYEEPAYEEPAVAEPAYEEPAAADPYEPAPEPAFEEAIDIEADAADVSFSESEYPATAAAEDVFEDLGEVPADGGFTDEATRVASVDEMDANVSAPEVAPPPEMPAAPAGFQLAEATSGVLARPIQPPTWWPEPQPRPERPAASGYFEYGGELPVPAEPPRPEIDPSMRVSPAPRPIEEGQAPQVDEPMQVAEAEPVYEEAPEHEPAYEEPEPAYEAEASPEDAYEPEQPAEGYEEAYAEQPAAEPSYEEPEASGYEDALEAPVEVDAGEYALDGEATRAAAEIPIDDETRQVELPEGAPVDDELV